MFFVHTLARVTVPFFRVVKVSVFWHQPRCLQINVPSCRAPRQGEQKGEECANTRHQPDDEDGIARVQLRVRAPCLRGLCTCPAQSDPPRCATAGKIIEGHPGLRLTKTTNDGFSGQ